MFPHKLIKRVSVESDHGKVDQSGTLPPLVSILGAEESRGEGEGERFSCSGSHLTEHLFDDVPEGEQCQKIEESN